MKWNPDINKRIPKSFEIMGSTITVRFDSNINDSDDSHGFACYRTREIVLYPANEKFCEDIVVENFWHEFSHWICYYAGNANISETGHIHENEKFVDLMGALLKQAIESMLFDTFSDDEKK